MTLLIIIIVLSLVFDYINGFHDAANSIATIVATKVLTPFQAVLWAAFFNFLAYWVFGFTVADAVAKTADSSQIDLVVILAGVVAAIIWNLLTWLLGIPTSSSHTLIGGFAGAALAHSIFLHGFSEYSITKGSEVVKTHWYNIVNWYSPATNGGIPSGVVIIIAFIVLAPIIGMIISYFMSIWMMYSSKKNIYPKIFSLILIGLTIWFISSVLVYDIKPEDAKFENHFLSFLTFKDNIKWFLVGLIFLSLAVFNLLFSSFSTSKSEYILKKMQLISSAAFSLGHGGNDSQKVMGIIAAAVVVFIKQNPHVNMTFSWIDLNVILPSEINGIKNK